VLKNKVVGAGFWYR